MTDMGWRERAMLALLGRPYRATCRRLRSERDEARADRARYRDGLLAIRDAAPTASTVHRLADAALRGEGADARQ